MTSHGVECRTSRRGASRPRPAAGVPGLGVPGLGVPGLGVRGLGVRGLGAFWIGALAIATLASGCGYTLGYRLPTGVTTIAVPIFDNQTFPLRREVEHDLTEAFREQIQLRTSLVLTDQSKADMVVYGTIRRFRERAVAEDRVDRKIESNISAEVELVVEDYRNKKRSREVVTRIEPLSVQSGETFETARARAIANLAERLVTRIEDWGPVDDDLPEMDSNTASLPDSPNEN
jgi:hypothetical protein